MLKIVPLSAEERSCHAQTNSTWPLAAGIVHAPSREICREKLIPCMDPGLWIHDPISQAPAVS
jgi:hypothetical protein